MDPRLGSEEDSNLEIPSVKKKKKERKDVRQAGRPIKTLSVGKGQEKGQPGLDNSHQLNTTRKNYVAPLFPMSIIPLG